MIYVDDIGILAKVWNKRTGRHVESRWYHLISDQIDTAELHAFAARLGLHRSYFQQGTTLGGSEVNPGHDHYDVTVGKRKQAIALGAHPIDWRELAEISMVKRREHRARRSVDLSGRGCQACVHVLSEHEIEGTVRMKCLHLMCDCEFSCN